MSAPSPEPCAAVERPQMNVDIACVGFGPAMGGFLTTLSRSLLNPDGSVRLESAASPGLPLQVICCERADGLGFGVSGAVTRARGIRSSFPGVDLTQIPMAAAVKKEKLVYLLDPLRASRRSFAFKAADRMLRSLGFLFGVKHDAYELPYTPGFMKKHDGLIFSLGQFNQWVSDQVAAAGMVQIWPGMPVAEPLIEKDSVAGVRLADQGTDLQGHPEAGFTPGMDLRAALTVVGDGPVGAVGRQIDETIGMPKGHKSREWALGMKMVIELREDSGLEPGTVFHTIGFPEPEIFGFLYVHPDRMASVGIFVPSWFRSPVRTAYRYLQHFILHPYLWRHLEGGTLKSWGAKSLQESGRDGEPFLAGNGYARIGEGSGSTNILAGSGVDEAWTTGVQLAEAVIELAAQKRPFTRENLEATYVRRRRESWVDRESTIAAGSREGFQRGVITGMIGMAIAGLTARAIWAAPVAHTQSPTFAEGCLRLADSCGRTATDAAGVHGHGHSPSRPDHGPLRMAADSDGRQAAHLPSRRIADGGRSASGARLCESRDLSAAGTLPCVRNKVVRGNVFRAGDYSRRKRRARI